MKLQNRQDVLLELRRVNTKEEFKAIILEANRDNQEEKIGNWKIVGDKLIHDFVSQIDGAKEHLELDIDILLKR